PGAEPFAVAVERQPQLSAGRRQRTDQILQVLGLRRVGMVMREVAIDFTEKLGHVATETTKQRRCKRTGDAVAAVDRYLHRTRERDIAGDAVEISGGDVAAAVAPGAGTEGTGFDAHLQRL